MKRLLITIWCIVYSLWFMLGSCVAQEEKFFDPSTPLRVNGERSRTIEIRAKKFSYHPNIIKVDKGDLVRIRLISEDVHHGFFLDGYGVKTSAHPGQDGAVKFVADKTGRFSFRCSVTCGEFHPYMVGYLIVGPNTRFIWFTLMAVIFGLMNTLFIIFRKKQNGQGQAIRTD